MTTGRHIICTILHYNQNKSTFDLRMSFSDTVVQGEAIESDFESETNGDANQKVNSFINIELY